MTRPRDGTRTWIVAELSANHNSQLERALATVEAAAEAGADAIKLQTYRPESLTLDVSTGPFGPIQDGPWAGWRPYDLFSTGMLAYEWHETIFARARDLGLMAFSAPFDVEGVAFLETLDCPVYKIASLEIAHVPLLEAVAATGKPVLVSTGAATVADIELALDTLGRDRNDVTLLKCTTAYPTPFEEVQLRSMPTLGAMFDVPVGLSDHTPGHSVAVAAVALGAKVVEKHLTLDRADGGIDAAFSMEPSEFSALVSAVRDVERALGNAAFRPSLTVLKARSRGRSLFVAKPIAAGERLTEENIRVVRPAQGLHPRHYREVLGREATHPLKPGKALEWSDICADHER